MEKSIKPVKWDAKHDALACCGCGEVFRKNDLVYPHSMTGGVIVHYRRDCARLYDSLGDEADGSYNQKS